MSTSTTTATRWVPVTVDTAARRVLGDRGATLVSLGFYLVVVSVVAALWRAAAEANHGDVAGYSAIALTWYIAASEAATVSLNLRLIEDIGDDIGSGAVAVELLRPASVLGVRMATQVGRGLPRLAACVLLGAALCTAVVGAPPNWTGALLAIPSLVLAIVCNLVAQHAFGAIAFWIRDARSTWFLYQKFVFLVGGMLMPLEILPDTAESVAKSLPFMAMAYAPARLAAGHVEPHLLAVQAGWIVVLAAMTIAVFAAGERKLQTVGG